MKQSLTKSFTREFPLIHVQMWGRRYSSEFLGEPMPALPFYVFKYSDGLVTAYRNIAGQTKAVNEIIKNKIAGDRLFIERLANQKKKIFTELIRIIKQNKITRRDFRIYLTKLFDVWQLHYISQFLPLDKKRFSRQDRDRALSLRKTVDNLNAYCWQSITTILRKLFPGLGDLVVFLTWDEINENHIPGRAELKKRASREILLYNGEIINKLKLEKLKAKYNFILENEKTDLRMYQLTGETAFPGKARGRARIVLKEKQAKTLKRGEILVSYMTMPAFTAALKKATAFITDEGGITSHAAIIAREMKKPSIIGTKIATKVLRDGDLLEVDANRGVVKILKRK